MAKYPDGEDDKTMAVLVTRLQKLHKWSKDKWDKALVKQLMDSTFSCRRKALINDSANVQIIADDYSFICNEEEVNEIGFLSLQCYHKFLSWKLIICQHLRHVY